MDFSKDTSGDDNKESLASILNSTSTLREQTWGDFYLKVEASRAEDGFIDLSVDQLPEALRKPGELIEMEPSDFEKHIVDIIENQLGSNLKELLYEREKYKILHDKDSFSSVDLKFGETLKKLIVEHGLAEDEIQTYISFCLKPNEKVCDFVENKVYSQFKQTYLNLLASNGNKHKTSIWKDRTLMEWNYLIKHLPEHGVINYAFNVAITYNANNNN